MEDSFLGERKKALGNRVVSVASSLSIPFQYVNGIWVILVKNLHKRKVTQQHTYATHIDREKQKEWIKFTYGVQTSSINYIVL